MFEITILMSLNELAPLRRRGRGESYSPWFLVQSYECLRVCCNCKRQSTTCTCLHMSGRLFVYTYFCYEGCRRTSCATACTFVVKTEIQVFWCNLDENTNISILRVIGHVQTVWPPDSQKISQGANNLKKFRLAWNVKNPKIQFSQKRLNKLSKHTCLKHFPTYIQWK